MGLTEDHIDQVIGEYGEEDEDDDDGKFGVWEENAEIVDVFLRLETQWRIGPMGNVLGLNYPSVESLLRLMRVRQKTEVFNGLQIMERAALPLLNGITA